MKREGLGKLYYNRNSIRKKKSSDTNEDIHWQLEQVGEEWHKCGSSEEKVLKQKFWLVIYSSI